MEKLKCESCGGFLEVDDSGEYATCSYCKAKYKLNDDNTIRFKMDDNTKETVTKGLKLFGAFHLMSVIPVVVIFFVIVGIIIYSATVQMKDNKKIEETKNSIIENTDIDDEIKDTAKKYEIDAFNRGFEMYSGTKGKFLVSVVIDKIVTNNKKNKDHLVTVKFEKISTTNPNEIIALKKKLKDQVDYEVIFDYDNNGYINKMTIQK